MLIIIRFVMKERKNLKPFICIPIVMCLLCACGEISTKLDISDPDELATSLRSRSDAIRILGRPDRTERINLQDDVLILMQYNNATLDFLDSSCTRSVIIGIKKDGFSFLEISNTLQQEDQSWMSFSSEIIPGLSVVEVLKILGVPDRISKIQMPSGFKIILVYNDYENVSGKTHSKSLNIHVENNVVIDYTESFGVID